MAVCCHVATVSNSCVLDRLCVTWVALELMPTNMLETWLLYLSYTQLKMRWTAKAEWNCKTGFATVR